MSPRSAPRTPDPHGAAETGFYRVVVSQHRWATYLVRADTLEDARADANELVVDDDWFTIEDEDIAITAAKPQPGEPMWTGGPEGEWDPAPNPRSQPASG